MTHLLLLALLSQAPDAPVVAPRPAVVLKAGEAMPFDGLALDDAQAIVQANKVATADSKWSPVVVVAIAVGALLVGGAVGLGVGRAIR